MKLQIAKVSSSLESLKNHSDQIQQDIDRVNEKDTDIENIKISLVDMKEKLKQQK